MKLYRLWHVGNFFQENNEEKLIMSDKFIYRGLFGKMNI